MTTGEDTHPDPRAWEGWETPPGIPHREALELLAADAAELAVSMLAGGAPVTQDPLVDAVRLIATPAGAAHIAAAARLTGIPEDDLRRLVLAHRHGGPGAVAAAWEATPCGPEVMAVAVEEVRRCRTFIVDELTVEAGTITDPGAGVRLCHGPDGRWHPLTLVREQWWPAPGSNAAAGAAYQAAARARALRRANG